MSNEEYNENHVQQLFDKERHKVESDRYGLSVSEICSWLDKGRLNLTPVFQRLFRWKDDQQSKLIESILLGLPLPPIFAFRVEGKYEVIDGVQRLSTIKRFVDGELTLQKMSILHFLNDRKYSDLPMDIQLTFDTARIDANFLGSKDSDPKAKFELFVRLNTGGTKLERQEVRDCLIVSLNENYYKKVVEELANANSFKNCLLLNGTKEMNSFDNELVVRFLLMTNVKYREEFLKNSSVNLHDWLDETIEIKIKTDTPVEIENDKQIFLKTFSILEQLGEDSLRRYDNNKERFTGATTTKSFELIALAIGYQVAKNSNYNLTKQELEAKIKTLWFKDFENQSYAGFNRTTSYLQLGEEVFSL